MLKQAFFMMLVRHILLTAFAALLLNTILYYNFISTYTKHVFREDLYTFQYSQTVYKHRILGTALVLQTYHVLKKIHPENEEVNIHSDFTILGNSISKNFYDAYFIVNSTFMVLSAVLLVIFFSSSFMDVSTREKLIYPLLIVSIMGFSQFVITPYDMMSYSFFLAIIIPCLHYQKTKKIIWAIATGILLFVSVFNRETGVLAVSLYAAWLFSNRIKLKDCYGILLFLFACYILPYTGLRIFSPDNRDVVFSNTFVQNLTTTDHLTGILFWVVMLCVSMALSKTENRKSILLFHVLSLPYILICFISGLMVEIRLYLPLFIGSLILGLLKKQPEKAHA